MTRLRTRLAGVLTVPLVLTACGSVSSAAAGLQEDAAAANAALAGAKGIGVVVRFDDPDGDLERALQEGPGALSADLAGVVVGSRVEVRLAAKGGRTLGDQPDPGLPLGEQLRWTDSALTLSTSGGDLLSWRTVDGVLYVSSDLDEVERVAAAAGSPLSLQDEVAGAPAPLSAVHDALRAGQAVQVPVADLLAPLGRLAGQDGEVPVPDALPEGLLDDLRSAVEPHARLTDLGSDDGVRRVTVEVDVRQLLLAVSGTLASSLPQAQDLDADVVSDATVTGTLTIDHGHYRRLELPMAELAELAEKATAGQPHVGDSALVVELDDTVASVEPPSRVADLDLVQLLGNAHAQPPSSSGASSLPEGPVVEQTQDELLACFGRAETEEDFAACGEPG